MGTLRPPARFALLVIAAMAAAGSWDSVGSAGVATADGGAPHADQSSSPGGAIASRAVSFEVRNVNRSKLRCPTNGEEVKLAGRIVGPRRALAARNRSASVTLYLHEFSFGKWMWNFPDPTYDFVTNLARRGHVSVIIDRLGYDDSPRPHGREVCLGGDADMAHQIVSQLRRGSYGLGRRGPRGFDRVVLAGHSGGGMVAQVAAYSFGDIDGLINFAHVDQGFTPSGLAFGAVQGSVCALGGQPSEPGQARGYAYFAQLDAEWRYAFMHNADPEIAAAATGLRNRDPCGDVYSFVRGHLVDHRHLREVAVPTLLLYPLDDTNYSHPAAGKQQRRLFTGSPDVTLRFFPGAHAMPLQRSAPRLQATVARWLTSRGLK